MIRVRIPLSPPAFARLRLATFLGELRLGKPATPAKADLPLAFGLPPSSASFGWASQPHQRRRTSRSPSACHLPRRASAGQASHTSEGCLAESTRGKLPTGALRRRTSRSTSACLLPRRASAGQARYRRRRTTDPPLQPPAIPSPTCLQSTRPEPCRGAHGGLPDGECLSERAGRPGRHRRRCHLQRDGGTSLDRWRTP